MGGRLKRGGSRPGATVPWAAGRRARAAEPAAPAPAPAGAVRSTPSWPAPPAPPSARSPETGRPDCPSAAGRDLKPQGAGRSHTEPPRPRLLGGKESGDKEQGRGPRAPTPQTRPTLGALNSGGKWGEDQVGLKASALSPQFRPYGTDHAAVTHKWPRVTGLAASSRLGGRWGV